MHWGHIINALMEYHVCVCSVHVVVLSALGDISVVVFEQEIETWSKLVVSKVASQCTNMKFTSTTCNTCEMGKIILLKVTSVYDMHFFQFTVKSTEI